MDITPQKLTEQYHFAVLAWGLLIDAAERAYALPSGLLYAVGSRETNLAPQYAQGVAGDHGHGRGLWQLDDRSHTIPAGFGTSVAQQADSAAKLLSHNYTYLHSWRNAVSAYNAGLGAVQKAITAKVDPDTKTTGGDYGKDVMDRYQYLLDHLLPIWHTVVSGDTLTKIAKEHGVELATIYALNPGLEAHRNRINVGEKYRVR